MFHIEQSTLFYYASMHFYHGAVILQLIPQNERHGMNVTVECFDVLTGGFINCTANTCTGLKCNVLVMSKKSLYIKFRAGSTNESSEVVVYPSIDCESINNLIVLKMFLYIVDL